MTRIKLILLSMVAVLGVCVVAVASASALETRYSVEGSELTSSVKLEGEVSTAWLNAPIVKEKTLIECKKNKLANATVEEKGKSKGEITYEECTLFLIKGGVKTSEAAKCKVETPIKFSFIDLLIGNGPGGILEDEFKPKEGTTFVTIVIKKEGSEGCLFSGEFKAVGEYDASLGAEGEVQKPEHELVFTSTGSKVTLGGEKAAYTNTVTKLKLENSKPWYAG